MDQFNFNKIKAGAGISTSWKWGLLLANRLLFISTLFWLICRQSDPQLWLVWMTLNSVEVSGKSDTTLCCIVTLEAFLEEAETFKEQQNQCSPGSLGVFSHVVQILCVRKCSLIRIIFHLYKPSVLSPFSFILMSDYVQLQWRVTKCLICLAHNLTIIKNMSLLCCNQWYHRIHQL